MYGQSGLSILIQTIGSACDDTVLDCEKEKSLD